MPPLRHPSDFLGVLREAGIVNATTKPWIHGYKGPGNYHTDFEADDYDDPSVLCLGKKGRLVTSKRWEMGT